MSVPKGQSLKLVLDAIPPGFYVDSKWLTKHGIGKNSAHAYDRTGWLERVAWGAYRRPYPNASTQEARDWKSAVLSAQWIMGYAFHIGGMTALTLDGHNHYVSLGRSLKVYAYGNVPNWLTKLPLDCWLITRVDRLFGDNPLGIENNDFDPSGENAPNPWNWPLKRSSPERAILEALNELPGEESFHVIDMIFPGLTMLRPSRMQRLLEICTSVKVKRLFLLFAERHQHKWLPHIERGGIDLGSGPRKLVEGGRYVSAYQLTVPSDLAPMPGREADGP